jgi:predicted amidohydrolase
MLNRREFIRAAAAGATLLARGTGRSSAASFDLIVKGGRVIDPSLRIDGIRDVAIAGGRIAAVEPEIAAAAAEVLDARGKIVVPGLLDIHTHAGRVKDGPALCLADGVTGFIDAGSQGADRISEPIAIVKSAPQPARVLINNASRLFEVFRDRGTLNVGAPADIALLELRQGSFAFVDNYGNTRTGSQRLFPAGTVLGGKRAAPRA